MVEKAVPVVLRRFGSRVDILMFRHPNAGIQIVKGTVESGEPPAGAALRELREESGIVDGGIIGPLGRSTAIVRGEHWHFYQCGTGILPDGWRHHTDDDGGLELRFFWQDLNGAPPDRCDPVFLRALSFIRDAICAGSLDTTSP